MAQRGKGKPMAYHGSDFIALGSKTGTSSGAKRDGASVPPSSGILPKKPKMAPTPSSAPARPTASAGTSGMMPGHSALSMPNIDKSHFWESLAIDIDPGDLVDAVAQAEDNEDKERIEALLCGAVKLLRNNRAKPDQAVYLSLLFLAKCHEHLFVGSENIVEAFCSLLRRDLRESYKSKGNALVSILAANVLLFAFRNEKTWPEIFVRVYIEDALGERVWVDQADCKSFVDNVLTAFNTKCSQMTSANIFYPGVKAGGGVPTGAPDRSESCPSPPVGGSRSESGSATPTRNTGDDDSMQDNLPINVGDAILSNVPVSPVSPGDIVQVVPRYQGMEGHIERSVMDVIHEQLNRRQGPDNITRNFLKFLTNACGLVEVRQTVITKLEMWIMNPKISRQAQDLLLSVAVNCCTHSQADIDVIGNFIKLRLKNKPNVNLYLAALKELCLAHKENLPTLLKHTIFNELSNSRNPNNMSMLHVMFSCDTFIVPASLASVFLELLMQKDDYHRALRALLREIARALRYEINLQIFCVGLMQEPRTQVFKDFEFKDRMFLAIVDIITLAIFQGTLHPAVRESMTGYWRNDKKDPDRIQYKKFLHQTAQIQQDALAWVRDSALKWYRPDSNGSYLPSIHKLLFIANPDEYTKADLWPSEDRGLCFKATSEIPLHQDSLLSILIIGISKTNPLNARDAVDLVEVLVKRASGLHPLSSESFQVLSANKVNQIMECLFQATAYIYPESIVLPAEYSAPSMAIAAAYWKAWLVLVLLCAHNPSEFGSIAWDSYPTLRACMEMCITNQFMFPPPTIASGEQADELRAKELQVTSLEKQAILDFEMHLAAATNKTTITESNSLLLAQLISLDPSGSLRRPPPAFLDQLQQANQHYKIGHLLCRSRNPDFLLDILQRQGTNQAMPWLADLVESSEGSFNVLPVQCLCEFLLNSSITNRDDSDDSVSIESDAMSNKKLKQKQLLLHLQDLLQNPKTDFRICTETLEYFLRRLSSQQTRQRLQALRGLRLVLTPMTDDGSIPEIQDKSNEWLLVRLPALPHFATFFPQISNALRVACQCENDPNAISLYIQFLANYLPEPISDFTELCLDLGSIIVERSTILPAILPGSLCKTDPQTSDQTYASLLGLFNHYMGRVRLPHNVPVFSTENQEVFNIVWGAEGPFATVHYCTVLAQIILLTYGPPSTSSASIEQFHQLFQIWYPSEGQDMPRAYSAESSDELDLIPDWLKLRMIRSEAGVLVDAALNDLEPQKLVLFIQSFGIPVASMSKLLQKLDRIVQTDFEGVNEAVMDKTYMGHLVQVQHQRGAIGGHIFSDALGLNLTSTAKKDSKEGVFKTVRRVPPIVPPRSTAIIPPAAVKGTLLHLFDVGSPSRMTLKEKQDTLRTLQKFLTNEIRGNSPMMPMMEATAKAFDQILKSDLKDSFTVALLQRTAFSCGIFSLICNALLRPANSDSASSSLLFNVCQTILTAEQKSKSLVVSPLKSVLENFIKKSGKRPLPQKSKKADLESKITNEDKLRLQVEEAISRKSTKTLVDSMAKMLLKGDEKKSARSTGNDESKVGLLIDWLQMLDPELVQATSENRLGLLFAQMDKQTSNAATKITRPHLLTLLMHQASWLTLRETVDKILSKFNPAFDPSVVLDFLTTCVHLQKQWQCRDRHVPKHDSGNNQDVLDLSDPQVDVMLDFCLEEVIQNCKDLAAGRNLIQKRIPLIITAIPSRAKAAFVADLLQSKLKSSTLSPDDDENVESVGHEDKLRRKEAVQELFLQIYMKVPQCLLHFLTDDRARLFAGSISTEGNTSVVDCISHTLLSALAGTQQGREWSKQMMDFETATRKVAASHPILFLRNLPLIAASLKGRTQYDFSFFRTRNHMTLFAMTLGVMELLVPYIFRPEYSVPLQEALLCYFDMMNAYFDRKESMLGLVDKFVSFLHKYVEYQPSEAVRFVRQHGTMLPEYAKSKEGQGLSSIKTLIGMTRVTETAPSQAETTSTVACFGSQSFTLSEHGALQSEARRIFESVSPSGGFGQTDTDLCNALELAKKSSIPRPGILPHMMEEILASLSHSNKRVRMLGHDLLLLLLKHSPNLGSEVLPSLLDCFQSADHLVALNAIEKLPDFAPLLEDHLLVLMSSAFAAGIHYNLDVTTHIADTIAILNSQKGY